MAGGLYGAPEGISRGIHDTAFMAEEPLKLARMGQEVSQANLTTQTMQLDLDARKRMIQAMGALGTNTQAIKSPADMADALGGMWLQAGDPDKAMHSFSTAEIMRNHQANTVAAQGRAKLEEIQAHDKMLQYEVGQLQGVNSQAELDDLNARLEQQFGHAVPWKGMPYSPELKENISKTLLTASQQMRLDLDRNKFGWQKEYQSALLALKKAQLRLAGEREGRIAHAAQTKEGKVSEPTMQQVNQASGIIRLAHPSFLSAPEDMQDNLATKVAEKARELMAQNRGLKFTEAAQQALADPTVRGDLKAISDAQFSGSIWNRLQGATPPEHEEPTPLQGMTSVNPLPYSKDAGSYEEGQWYYNQQGQPAKFMNGPWGKGLYTQEALKEAE